MFPDDYIHPVWRCYMNGTGVGSVALDPREAEFVLERGYAIWNGERYIASLDGMTGLVDNDGRIAIRLVLQ